MKIFKNIVLFILLSLSIHAQEIGISGMKNWSDNSEILNPTGIGLFLYQPIWKLGVKVEYSYSFSNREYFGRVVSGFMLELNNYFDELVKSDSEIHSFEFNLVVPKLLEYSHICLNIGLGIHFSEFTGERLGLSSKRKVKVFSENKIGPSYFISLSKEHFLNYPFKLELLYKIKNSFGTIQVTDTAQPYRGDITMNILQFNVSYIF